MWDTENKDKKWRQGVWVKSSYMAIKIEKRTMKNLQKQYKKKQPYFSEGKVLNQHGR